MEQQTAPLWRVIQRNNFTKLESLLDFLAFSEKSREKVAPFSKFALNVPRRLAEKMVKNSVEDPIFLQFVPLKKELEETEGFVADPVSDRSFCQSKKLIKKYEGRALLLSTSACAMHCRYCFRQNFPYETKERGFTSELQLLRQDPSIHEVILSGGDPLSLSDAVLERLFSEFEEMTHIQRIRFHTRFPIGIPERIDSSFLSLLKGSSKQIFFCIHSNHPRELDEEVIAALRQVMALQIPVLNQSVFLKGVNDQGVTLLELSEKLINAGIIPYYLHQLDRVQGAAHFSATDQAAIEALQYVHAHLSGFGVPRLAREEAGEKGKTFLY